MAKEKQVKPTKETTGKPVKEKKPQTPTVVSKIKEFGADGVENREELAKKVFNFFDRAGVKSNSKGKELKESKVLSLVSSVIRDIKAKRPGWWSTYEVTETETELKVAPKN